MSFSESSISKKFFLDRTGDSIREPLIWDPVIQQFTGSFNVGVVGSVLTSPPRRLGKINSIQDVHVEKTLEDVGYGAVGKAQSAVNIGSTTVFLNEQQNAKDLIDFYRKGRNIKNVEHYSRASTTIPMMRVSTDRFFEDELLGIIEHNIEFSTFGQGNNKIVVDENLVERKLIPFQDTGKLVPSQLLGRTQGDGYPFVHNNDKNYKQFVDPSDEKVNGSIDVFSVRRSLTNAGVSDIKVKGIKCHMQGGGVSTSEKGAYFIENRKKYTDSVTVDHFEDVQEVFSISNVTGSISFPGYITHKHYVDTPYNDNLSRNESNKYSFLSNDQKNTLLINSDLNRSEIGLSFKSSTNGLIFGESNILGTDSIAFGGLKK